MQITILRKIYKLLAWPYLKTTSLSEAGSEYLVCDESSYLKDNGRIDFRVKPELRTYVKIGRECIIDSEFIFESTGGFVSIGKNVHIGGAKFISRTAIEVGNDVTMAWGIILYDHDSHSLDWTFRCDDNKRSYLDYQKNMGHSLASKQWDGVKTSKIKICDKVWIGFDVVVLKGVTIGEGAVIGARSVVTRDVPAWTVAAGNPARIVKTLHEPDSV